MSTKTNFSKKKRTHPGRRGCKDSYTWAPHPRVYAPHPRVYRNVTRAFSRKDGAKGVAARDRGRVIGCAHPHECRSVHAFEPNDLSNEGNAKKTVASVGGLARRHASRRLDARRQTDTRASLRSIPTIMAPMAEKTFNVDVDRCVSRVARARDRDRDRASASID